MGMAFLDFIQNRKASQQRPAAANTPQTPKPETAKEMYSRQAARETVNPKALEQLSPDQRAKVDAIKERLEKATQHIDKNAQSPASAPSDSMGNREALRQSMTGQDKTAPALSPTSAETGRTAVGNAPAPSNETPAKTPAKPAERAPQTVPRPRPSWER
jgi:hypothetical protein